MVLDMMVDEPDPFVATLAEVHRRTAGHLVRLEEKLRMLTGFMAEERLRRNPPATLAAGSTG